MSLTRHLSICILLGALMTFSCAKNSELEIEVSSTRTYIIPDTKTQSCYERYLEDKNPTDTPVYDIDSRFFILKNPKLKWNNETSNFDIVAMYFKPNESNSCKVTGNKTISPAEIALIFSKKVYSSQTIKDYKQFSRLYGSKTDSYNSCSVAYTALSSAVISKDDFCPSQITADTCSLIIGSIQVAKDVSSCILSGTLEVYGIKIENNGNLTPVKASTSIQVENLF